MSHITPYARRRVRWAVALTAATVAYSANAYVDVTKLLGIGYYDMRVDLADGAGLYPGSVVTLSGATVGDVQKLVPTADGAVATIRVDDDVDVPKSAVVRVASISAAGEQYLDISASDTSGPVYRPGSTIPVSDAVEPVSTEKLLADVNGLVDSVPISDLRTSVDEIGGGLADGGRDLSTFLDAIVPLQETFTENLEPTASLIDDGETVLETQKSAERQLATSAADLAEFSSQLRDSDRQLRGTLQKVPPMDAEIQKTIRELDPEVAELLTSTGQVAEVSGDYDAGIRQTLTVLPGLTAAFQTALDDSPLEGSVSLFARSNVNDPPPCTQGFVQNRRSPREITPIEPPTDVWCKVPSGSPQAVRGARNYPCPVGLPRGPVALTCGQRYQSDAEIARVQKEALATQVSAARRLLAPEAASDTKPYDPLAGVTPLPAGLGALTSATSSTSGATTWESLLMNPLSVS